MKFNMHKNLISEKFKSMFFVATLSMLIEYVVLLSDNIIAGNLLGEKALSAITLISPFFSIMFFLSFIFSIGTGILTAYEIGKGNREKVNQYFSQGIILAVIFGVCLNITFLLLKKQLLSLFEVSFNIYKYAYDYFSVLIWIPLPIILSSVLYEVVISEGGEKRCFYSSIVQVGSNIIISIVLCKLIGIKGIALGTVISNILAALVIASYFLYEHNELRFKWYINLKSIVDMVKYSINDALNYFYLAVTQFLMNVFLVSNFGERVIIVYTVVNNMLSLLMAVTDGIGGTIQSIISVYRGENNFLGIKKTMYIASFVAAIEGIIINAAIIIMADFIPKIFGINESDILHEAVKAARIFSFFSIFNSILMLMSSYYVYMGRIRLSIFIGAFLLCIMPVFCGIIFGLTFGLEGVWIGIMLSSAFTFGIVMIYIKIHYKKLEFPLLFDVKEIKNQLFFDAEGTKEGVMKLRDEVEQELILKKIDKKRMLKILSAIEEVEMLAVMKNKKEFYIECTIFLGNEIIMILRDTGEYINVKDDIIINDSISTYTANRIINGQNSRFMFANGYNRMIFYYP